MVLGVLTSDFCAADKPVRFHLFGTGYYFSGTDFKPVSDAFIRLIRMMIAPIIFTTVVTGIAGMGNLKRLGRIGLKSFIYFEVMTTLALIMGWMVAAAFKPGKDMNVQVSTLNTADLKLTLEAAKQHHSIIDFVLNI